MRKIRILLPFEEFFVKTTFENGIFANNLFLHSAHCGNYGIFLPQFFRKISVKSKFLLKNFTVNQFDEKNLRGSEFLVFPHCVSVISTMWAVKKQISREIGASQKYLDCGNFTKFSKKKVYSYRLIESEFLKKYGQ